MNKFKNTEQLYQTILKEIVYLKNSFENAVIKISKQGTFIKFKGKDEFKDDRASKVTADAILELNSISKSEYENF